MLALLAMSTARIVPNGEGGVLMTFQRIVQRWTKVYPRQHGFRRDQRRDGRVRAYLAANGAVPLSDAPSKSGALRARLPPGRLRLLPDISGIIFFST